MTYENRLKEKLTMCMQNVENEIMQRTEKIQKHTKTTK